MPGKDAITLLTSDHSTVKELFTKYESLGRRAYKSKQTLVERMTEELSVHAAIEEEVFYPSVRRLLPDEEDDVLESLEEHHIVKTILLELASLTPQQERFQPKVTVLIEDVRHHMEEEEEKLFPAVRKSVSSEDLAEIGAAMEVARRSAPTRPHPHAPDTPPGNLVAAGLAAPLDRAADVGRWALQRAKDAPAAGERALQLARFGWHAGREQLQEKMRARDRRGE